MPQLTGPLSAEGAIIDILVGLDRTERQKLRMALRPLPQPKQMRALVDSGAALTCLDPGLIQALSLVWDRPVLVNMPAVAGMTWTPMYRASVTILHSSGKPRMNFVVADARICELPLGVLGYDALIGRDILDLLRFTYDGLGQSFTLEWPLILLV